MSLRPGTRLGPNEVSAPNSLADLFAASSEYSPLAVDQDLSLPHGWPV